MVLSKFMFNLGFTATGRGNVNRYYRELKRNERRSANELEQISERKLRHLVKYANENVPYYAARFKECGLDVNGLTNFESLPLLRKEDIQLHKADLVSKTFPKNGIIKNSTGGSTGEPLIFYQSKEYFDWSTADIYRHLSWCGYRPGDRHAYIWGSDYDYSRVGDFRRTIRDFIKNQIWLNTFNASEEEYLNFAKKMSKFKPRFLVGYASSLLLFARLVKDYGVRLEGINGIESSAEVLRPEDRKTIEGALGSKVFDRYGCREVGNIAHECKEHDGLHVSIDNNYVEFVDGKVVVTNLNNYAFPFIRYEIGDLGGAHATDHSCGINLPLMKPITGRTSDIIKTPSGRFIHGEYFTHLFYGLEGIKQFQVVQTSVDHLVVNVVANEKLKKEFENVLKKRIWTDLDRNFVIDVVYKEKIPTTRSGKYRFTISKIH